MSAWKEEPKNIKVSIWRKIALSTTAPILTGEPKAGKHYNVTLRHPAVWEMQRDQ
jgi:hypothetical protein